MTALVAVACGVFGLVVGSFLNVVIWRVPRKESVVTPPSHCPGCEAPIAPRDNIPVLSWLLLRAKCRHCGTRISARYPAIEAGTAVLWAAVGIRFSDSWALPAYLLLAAALIAISAIDLEYYIIPNRIVYPVGYAAVPLLAVASAGEGDWWSFERALISAAAVFAFFFVLHVAVPNGMGLGDVRLSVILGLYLGWLGVGEVILGIFAGFVFGALIGVVLIAVGARSRRQHIPFGPFLAAGTMAVVLFGSPFLDWYRNLGR